MSPTIPILLPIVSMTARPSCNSCFLDLDDQPRRSVLLSSEANIVKRGLNRTEDKPPHKGERSPMANDTLEYPHLSFLAIRAWK